MDTQIDRKMDIPIERFTLPEQKLFLVLQAVEEKRLFYFSAVFCVEKPRHEDLKGTTLQDLNKQIDRQIDGLIDRQIDGLIDRQIDRQID